MTIRIGYVAVTILLIINTYFSQDESKIINQLFSSSNEITQLSTDLISIGVDAVWFASEVTGDGTITGTIIQSSQNSEEWTYSSSPNDKLVVIWANGDRLDYVFNQIEGYTEGDAEDFKNSHYMNFHIIKTGEIDLQIVSSTGPDDGILKWQRNIQGEVLYENDIMNVNINHNGQYQGEIGGGIGIYHYWEEALGQANSNSLSFTISEAYWKTMTHNSNTALFVLNTEIRNNSSASLNEITYKFQDAHVFWAAYTKFADSAYTGAYNMVIDAHQWEAEGLLLKDGQGYGAVQFSSQPVNDTYGPGLICKLNDGFEILLHSLLNPFVTTIPKTKLSSNEYYLTQNYPNPFNPITTIKYSIYKQSNVTINVFDVLGGEVATLVEKVQPQGNYEVEFDGSELTSGIYFYRLLVSPAAGGVYPDEVGAGDPTSSLSAEQVFAETRKMILLK